MSDNCDLRLEVSRFVATVLDAVSLSQNLTRNQLVFKILTEFAEQRHREASMIAKLMPINPADADSVGKARQ